MSQQNDGGPTRYLAGRAVGDVLDGTVVSAVPHGTFVEVADGVHGLVHESETSAALAPGSRVRVEVLAIDVGQGRLSLRPV
jgi:ribosomal protein S1